MFLKKSNKIICALFIILVIAWISPVLIGGSLLFYSQYQNGERCRWVNQQRSANSIWVEQNGDYMLSFCSNVELCELMRIEDNSSIKCEFFTSDLYIYNPGEELLEQDEQPMASATWLYDEKNESLYIEILFAENNGFCEDFGIKNGMVLTFIKFDDAIS